MKKVVALFVVAGAITLAPERQAAAAETGKWSVELLETFGDFGHDMRSNCTSLSQGLLRLSMERHEDLKQIQEWHSHLTAAQRKAFVDQYKTRLDAAYDRLNLPILACMASKPNLKADFDRVTTALQPIEDLSTL